MAQWVDITQIDNQTPFMKVRWRSNMSYSGDDTWLSEAPGLDTTGMDWSDGDTEALGYFGGHRMNHNEDWGNAYTCGFRCDDWGIDDGLTPNELGVHVKDAPRNQYYDNVVQFNNETYYEVDFSTWEGASGKSLYVPYATAPWDTGDIFVWVENSAIDGNKSEVTFDKDGGTDSTFEITAADDWTAVASDNWFALSDLSGTTGTTAIDITAQSYSGTSARTGTVTFTCSGETFVLTVNQEGIRGVSADTSALTFKATGGSETVEVDSDLAWDAVPSDNWISVSPASGSSGVSAVTIAASAYSDTTSARTGSVTFSSSVNTFIVSVTQKKAGSGFGGVTLGSLEIEAMYLGDVEIEGLYLGDIPLVEPGPPSWSFSPSAVTMSQASGTTMIRVASPTDWTIDAGQADWITLSTTGGTSGRTVVTMTISEYTGSTSRSATVTAMTTDSASSATCVVTQTYVSGLTIPHLVNYNAKLYDPAHLTIPNDENATFQEDIELSGTPVTYDSDSITFDPATNPYAFWTWNFGTTQNNPFNCTGNDSLTIIGKTDQTNGAHNHTLVGNRGNSGYNWMAREINDGMFLHTAFGSPDAQTPTIEYTSEPNIWMLTVSGQTGYGVSFTDSITGTVYTQVLMGAPSEGIGFFCDDRFGGTREEQYVGKFYWIFIAKGSLTPQEIQEVIDYNENL